MKLWSKEDRERTAQLVNSNSRVASRVTGQYAAIQRRNNTLELCIDRILGKDEEEEVEEEVKKDHKKGLRVALKPA